MVDALLALLSMLCLLWAMATHPKQARCTERWSVEGIRPDGRFSCHSPLPPNCGEPVPPYQQPCPDGHHISSRIYCTGGSRPIVVDYRTVGCQR